MELPSQQVGQPKLRPSKPGWVGLVHWMRSYRPFRRLVPPLMLVALIAALAVPLLSDLQLLNESDLSLVKQQSIADDRDGNLIVNVKNINPNNGVATIDVTYVTEDLDNEKVELWITSGGVGIDDGKLIYQKHTELHRLPVVMDSPTVFVLGDTRRATFKHHNTDIKIDQCSQGYFCPFDRYVLEFSFVLTDESEKPLHPKLWCELEDPHFVNAPPKPLLSRGKTAVPIPGSLTVVLERPLYEKIFLGLTLLMGLGCVLWTLYKVAYMPITAMESFSLLAFDFTVLMAVPALRGVFVPSNLQFAPLFDFFVVLIWTVGLLTLIVNIFRHDVMVRTRQAPAADGNLDSVPFVGDRRDPANRSQSVMSRRAAS